MEGTGRPHDVKIPHNERRGFTGRRVITGREGVARTSKIIIRGGCSPSLDFHLASRPLSDPSPRGKKWIKPLRGFLLPFVRFSTLSSLGAVKKVKRTPERHWLCSMNGNNFVYVWGGFTLRTACRGTVETRCENDLSSLIFKRLIDRLTEFHLYESFFSFFKKDFVKKSCIVETNISTLSRNLLFERKFEKR